MQSKGCILSRFRVFFPLTDFASLPNALSYLYPMTIYVRIYATVIVVNIAVNVVFVDMPMTCARAKQIFQDLRCGELKARGFPA
jgi:hypothetical protein